MVSITDERNKDLGSYYLPWTRADAEVFEQGKKKISTTYRTFPLYRNEFGFTKFLFFHLREFQKDLELGLSLFGSGSYWLFYNRQSGNSFEESPLSELEPFYDPLGTSPVLKMKQIYNAKLTVFSEENSVTAATIYFKSDSDGLKCGLNSDKLSIALKY